MVLRLRLPPAVAGEGEAHGGEDREGLCLTAEARRAGLRSLKWWRTRSIYVADTFESKSEMRSAAW